MPLPEDTIMLVLTRKIGETIVIGRNIHLTVVSVQGEKVRLGIIAPPSVEVATHISCCASPDARLWYRK